MSNPTPRFRRGSHPSWFGYHEATYVTVNLAKADQVWRRICHFREISGSVEIKKAMGVGNTTAARYRRVFDALGLVSETPGRWVPDAGWEDIWPASVKMVCRDPDAFSVAVAGHSDAYVLSVTARDTPRDKWQAIRFADGVRPPAVWVARPGERGGPGGLRETPFGCLTTSTSRTLVPESVSGRTWWDGATTVPPVVLVEEPRVVAGGLARERSEHATTYLPASLSAQTLIKAFGWSRATANRRLNDWVDEGVILKTGYGRWAKVGP